MNYLIGLLIFLALLLGITYGTALMRLRRVRLRSGPAAFPCTETKVDPDTRALYAPTAQALQALGFEPAFWYRLQEPSRQDNHPLPIAVWFHPDQSTYGAIAPHPLPDAHGVTLVELLTFTADGPTLQTLNGIAHHLGTDVPGWDMQDGYRPNLQAQWEFHCQRRAQQTREPRTLEADAFCAAVNQHLDDYQQALLQQKQIEALPDGRYRMTLRGGWRLLRQQQAATPKLRIMAAQAQQTSTPAADVLAHQRHDAMLPPTQNDTGGKLLLLLVSLAAFAVSFGMQLDPGFVTILVGVLLLHELGHLLAMAAFGFRDLQILFIPFFGAVATGKNRHCPAWQRALIDLAGPVPGIVLAGALWYSGIAEGSAFWLQTIVVLLVLNYLNLLPIHPLDGGHLLHLLLMQRWPRLQIAFWASSVLGMLALSWWLESAVLAGLGFLLAFTLRHQMREAQVLRRLRQQNIPPHDQEPELLRALYTAMHDLKMPWNFATRLQSARNLQQHLSVPLPSVRESLFGLTLYLLVLAGTPALLLLENSAVLQTLLPPSTEKTPDWEAQLATATTVETRLSILTEAGYYHHWSGDPDSALTYFRQAQALLTHPEISPAARAEALTGLAEALVGTAPNANPCQHRLKTDPLTP